MVISHGGDGGDGKFGPFGHQLDYHKSIEKLSHELTVPELETS